MSAVYSTDAVLIEYLFGREWCVRLSCSSDQPNNSKLPVIERNIFDCDENPKIFDCTLWLWAQYLPINVIGLSCRRIRMRSLMLATYMYRLAWSLRQSTLTIGILLMINTCVVVLWWHANKCAHFIKTQLIQDCI